MNELNVRRRLLPLRVGKAVKQRFSKRPEIWLRPHSELARPPGTRAYDWEAVGDDPQFLFRGLLPLPGWQMLEIDMEHDRGSAAVRLYLDMGQGFREEESIYLPVKPGRITKRLFYVPRPLKALRLDPMDAPGRFSIRHLRIAWLLPSFAHDRLAQRLSTMDYRWRGTAKKEILGQLKSEARREGRSFRVLALKAYDRTFSHTEVRSSYGEWLENQVEPHVEFVERQRQGFAAQPLISIVVPTYNTHPDWLCECIDSVLDQSYPNWQLCIADDASTDPRVRRVLEDYAGRDSRIEVTYREANGHICAASNTALQSVRGEYIALLDHDDRLVPNALYHVVNALNGNPRARVLYSDEDKIDDEGRRFDPHFKPKWNPDLLLGQNYIGHLAVMDTDLVREAGGFREGVEGSQDHDLLLRCTGRLSAEEIVHIPHVLYHWRAGEGSTALASGEKDYTTRSGVRAVRERVRTHSSDAVVEVGELPNTYRVRWPLPEPVPRVSLLIPTRDNVEVLQPCVDAILARTEYPNFEVLIVDNESTCPRTLDYFERVGQDPRVRLLEWHQPFNFSAINNFAAGRARGSILALVNNDIEPINADWLDEMVRQACRPEIGCVGAKLYYPNDTIQHAGVILGVGGVAGHSHKYFGRNEHGYFSRLRLVQNVSAVTGACLVVRREIFEQVGGLDEGNLAVTFNDVDFCLRVREAGYRNLWTPYAELYHHESVSRGVDDTPEKQARAHREATYMRQRWGKLLDNDPAYNPNLTLVHEDFSLR